MQVFKKTHKAMAPREARDEEKKIYYLKSLELGKNICQLPGDHGCKRRLRMAIIENNPLFQLNYAVCVNCS